MLPRPTARPESALRRISGIFGIGKDATDVQPQPEPQEKTSPGIGILDSSGNEVAIIPPDPSLAEFLQTSKARFIDYVEGSPEGQQQNGNENKPEWTVIMGNEAGDLDSVASSIAFAWLLHMNSSSQSPQPSTVPLIQIAPSDFSLRPENLFALQLAGIKFPSTQLFTISDYLALSKKRSNNSPSSSSGGSDSSNNTPLGAGIRHGLVDHNRLGSLFQSNGNDDLVSSIIDHHADEGYHTNAQPRLIQPAGSCASLVANQISLSLSTTPTSTSGDTQEIPRELATLLLCAILVDTDGLKPGGKALDVDYQAVNYLLPRSALSGEGTSVQNDRSLQALSRTLADKKMDVHGLSGRDLLRRDYKEYDLEVSVSGGTVTIKAGLSTVPVPLAAWWIKDEVKGKESSGLEHGVSWMRERGLRVLGVLTTFREAPKTNSDDKKDKDKDKKGKDKDKKDKDKKEKDKKIKDDEKEPEVKRRKLRFGLAVGMLRGTQLQGMEGGVIDNQQASSEGGNSAIEQGQGSTGENKKDNVVAANGKHRREMAWIVLEEGTTIVNSPSSLSPTSPPVGSPGPVMLTAKDLAQRLWSGLEGADELNLERYEKMERLPSGKEKEGKKDKDKKDKEDEEKKEKKEKKEKEKKDKEKDKKEKKDKGERDKDKKDKKEKDKDKKDKKDEKDKEKEKDNEKEEDGTVKRQGTISLPNPWDNLTQGGSDRPLIHVYKQGNAQATRKIIAPLLKDILEGKTEMTS